jgi:hypothetical protein
MVRNKLKIPDKMSKCLQYESVIRKLLCKIEDRIKIDNLKYEISSFLLSSDKDFTNFFNDNKTKKSFEESLKNKNEHR